MNSDQEKLDLRVRPRGVHDRRRSLGCFAVILALATAGASEAEPIVATTTGTFKAVPSPSDPGVDVFFGIRYAAPPVGALRWAPPRAPTPPSETVVAAKPGDVCPQDFESTAPLKQSEDCLFLNVYVPASATPQSALPVFYWIHGGALIFGTGADYDPSVMVAQNNIIVVTINYRLGALGWLVEPGLLATSPDNFQRTGDGGDYGLMDEEFGLQWVRDNIAGFGGDPAKVTIGGESAGGLSVSSILASTNLARGLFRGAIIESGGYLLNSVPSQTTYGADFGAAFDAALGCTPPADAACLRSQPVDKILTAQNAVFGVAGISPDTGTLILPQGLQQAFSTGQFIRVPVLQGSNANEGRLFEPDEIPFAASLDSVAAAGGPANYDLDHPNEFCASPQDTGAPATCTYPQEINLYLASLGLPSTINSTGFDALLATEYPLADFPDPFLPGNAPSSDEGLAQIFTDLVFACNIFDSNMDLATFVPVFAYEFNDPDAPPSLSSSVVRQPNDQFGFPTASEHASELQFLFDLGTTLDAGEQVLAAEMKTYWANFVTTLNPNHGDTAAVSAPWQSFDTVRSVQDLVPRPMAPHPFTTFPAEHFCPTWEPLLIAEGISIPAVPFASTLPVTGP